MTPVADSALRLQVDPLGILMMILVVTPVADSALGVKLSHLEGSLA